MEFENWALVPGPEHLDRPRMSFEVHEIAQYPIDEFAAAVLSFPGMRLERPSAAWHDWMARWQSGQHFIRLDLALLDGESPIWGGSSLRAICTLDEMIALWRHLLAEFPGVWMHNTDCEMHTLESFPRAIRDAQ